MRRLQSRINGGLVIPGAAPRVLHASGVLRALALFVFLAGAPPGAAQEAALVNSTSSGGVDYDAERERLSVSVADQPIVRVFDEISTQAGIGLKVHGTEHGLVSAEFHDLPLETGIRRLLSGRNHVIYHDAEAKGRIMVWILSSPGAVADTSRERSRPQATRPENRLLRRSAERSAERYSRDLYLSGSVENALPTLLDDLASENDIIRDAIAEGQLPQQLIDALEQESGQ